ncbi:MAG: spore coat protein CotJB [Anaeroplasmataceae bacterium]
MELAKIYINPQKYDINYDILNGLSKGSIWNNLYESYKFDPKSLSSSIDNIIAAYKFALLEIELFLDTHPDCEHALEDKKKMKTELKKALLYKGGNANVDL